MKDSGPDGSIEGPIPCPGEKTYDPSWAREVDPAPHERYRLIKGKRWNVLTAGEGNTIVFLHNGGGNLWNWAHQIQHFSSRYRVIAPDLPGFGRSHRPAEPLTLDRLVSALGDLLEGFECDHPILVGNCIGASIALEYALRQPGKVRALALFNVCGGPPMLSPGLRFMTGLQPRSPLGKALRRVMLNSAGHPLLRRFNKALIYAGGEPDLHPALQKFIEREYHDPALRPSFSQLVNGLESFSVFSRVCEKPEDFPPVFLGWGKENRTLDPKWAGFIADWLAPDAVYFIEEAGHMAIYEQPLRVNELLGSFFETGMESRR
jgi:pimeloyl-ACP methyl ester carboxylesterase